MEIVYLCFVYVASALCEDGCDFPGGDQLLDRSRQAIRQRRIDLAEALVMEAGDSVWKNAACLNVLGLIAEARGQWGEARRRWSRAARIDKYYQPARQNLRRYFELFQFGQSRLAVAFGDERFGGTRSAR